MPTLREVITRFKFETDKKGVDNVNRSIRGMKGGVGKLAKLFGVSLGVFSVRALFKMGIAADKARFNMQRLGGVDTKKLELSFENIQKRMDGIRKGSGELIKARDFFSAGAGFFKIFGRGSTQTKQFLKTFEFAAKLSAVTGENVSEMFQKIAGGIVSGDFSFLAEVPGFTRTRIQRITDILKEIDPGEFGGDVGRQQKLAEFLREAGKASGQIDKDLRNIPDTMLEANRSATQFADTIERLGEIVSKQLVPVLKQVANLLTGVNNFLGIELQTINEDTNKKTTTKTPSTVNSRVNKALFGNLVPEPLARATDRINEAIKQTIINNITINGATDPDAVARSVDKRLNEKFREAGRAIVQTEER